MTVLIPVFGEEFLVKLSAVEMWRGLFCPMLSLLNVAEAYLNARIVSMWVKCCGSAMCSQCFGFFPFTGWVTLL